MKIKRDRYLERLVALKHNGLVKVITGIRRCGKSFLLFNLFREHLRTCNVDSAHIIEIKLDDERQKALRNPTISATVVSRCGCIRCRLRNLSP